MERWAGYVLVALVLLAGAFGLSALAVEWRQDAPDLRPLEDDIAQLRADLAQLKDSVEAISRPPAPPTPPPPPEPIALRMDVGTAVEWRGMRLTVNDIQPNITTVSPRASFTLENVNASPETTTAFTRVKVVAPDGSLCRSGILAWADSFALLGLGEKTTFEVYFECPNLVVPKTLTFDDAITLEFAQPVPEKSG